MSSIIAKRYVASSMVSPDTLVTCTDAGIWLSSLCFQRILSVFESPRINVLTSGVCSLKNCWWNFTASAVTCLISPYILFVFTPSPHVLSLFLCVGMFIFFPLFVPSLLSSVASSISSLH
eukprot:Lithocolla_globosa_v1_NODE_947_length_3051_cov_30.298064.p3 type:complete len:120 gc:universal NODE_947_length_3051_cov_30.298064:1212-853(-)